MPELGQRQKAALTKRNRTWGAFLGAATAVFSERDYLDVRVEDIARAAGSSVATFYNTFPRAKSSWATAVLDARLNEGIDQQRVPVNTSGRAPCPQLIGHLGLLGEVSARLPGITQALVAERTRRMQYAELLPKYYGEVAGALHDGQEQQVLREDIEVLEMADFVLDSLASVYAIHLDERDTRPADMASILLDGLIARA